MINYLIYYKMKINFKKMGKNIMRKNYGTKGD